MQMGDGIGKKLQFVLKGPKWSVMSTGVAEAGHEGEGEMPHSRHREQKKARFLEFLEARGQLRGGTTLHGWALQPFCGPTPGGVKTQTG